MNRIQLASATVLITAVVTGSATLSAGEKPAENNAKLPQTLTVKCELDPFPYAFKPNRESWAIDRVTIGPMKCDLVLKRQDRGPGRRPLSRTREPRRR